MPPEAEHHEILDRGLAAMGINLAPEGKERLTAYCLELLRWNAKINLVAKAELAGIWESHFLDSLSLLRVLGLEGGNDNVVFSLANCSPAAGGDVVADLAASSHPGMVGTAATSEADRKSAENERRHPPPPLPPTDGYHPEYVKKHHQPALIDIGTGAGFPGLALKAACPDIPVILVEPRQKRVSFLRQVIRVLGLKEIEVVCGRLEKGSALVAGRTLSAPYVTSRAFTSIGDFLLHAEAVSPPGGRVICMKGPKAEEELAAWRLAEPNSPYRFESISEYSLPFSGKLRKLLVFRKEKA